MILDKNLRRAIASLEAGKFVLVFDSEKREGETDMVILSERVTPEAVTFMRKHAGGLICTTLDARIADRIGIPSYMDIINHASESYPLLRGLEPNDLKYDRRSSFSITVNHRETFTGITDRDRALTISELGRLCSMANDGIDLAAEFSRRFRTPGHVHLLIPDEHLVERRQGHTELVNTLLLMGGLTPSATICEMLSDEGKALPPHLARRFAARYGMVFLEGKEIIREFLNWRKMVKE